MEKGGEALRNLSPNGKVDLCLVVNEAVILIDVKLAQWHKSVQCWNCPAASLVKRPVYPVIVVPSGDNNREWAIKWQIKKGNIVNCPPGLENFWDE
jgi:hypothetical protein